MFVMLAGHVFVLVYVVSVAAVVGDVFGAFV